MRKFRSLIIMALFLFLITNVFSQYITPGFKLPINKFKVLDTASLCFTYKLTYVKDSLNPKKTYNDKQTLLIGAKYSKYFSQLYLDNSIKSKTNNSDNQEGVCGFEIYKNLSNQKTTGTELGQEFLIGGSFLYEEETPEMHWEIKKDTATILSYSCQKATTVFRGRMYEAWFTSDLPINNGPWKFGNLPGLILKVSDTKQHFVFECIGMEQLKTAKPIVMYDYRYIKSSRKDLMKMYYRLFNDTESFLISVRSEMVGQFDSGTLPKIPYNPIELE